MMKTLSSSGMPSTSYASGNGSASVRSAARNRTPAPSSRTRSGGGGGGGGGVVNSVSVGYCKTGTRNQCANGVHHQSFISYCGVEVTRRSCRCLRLRRAQRYRHTRPMCVLHESKRTVSFIRLQTKSLKRTHSVLCFSGNSHNGNNSNSNNSNSNSSITPSSEDSAFNADQVSTGLDSISPISSSRSINTATVTASESAADDSTTTTLIAASLFVGLALLVGLGVLYKDPISAILSEFTVVIEALGTRGKVLFVVVYTLLEVLAVPAAPLTMTAGVLFGVPVGASLVLCSATMAACLSFMITRYLARDKVVSLIKGDGISSKWKAVDKAIGEENILYL